MMPWMVLYKTVAAIELRKSAVRQMDLREPVVEFGRIDPVHPRLVLVRLCCVCLYRLGLVDRLYERSVGFRMWPVARGVAPIVVIVGVVVTRLV